MNEIIYIPQSSYNTELYHHGVLGMKWGVRRYQNPDGTLTAAGKRHDINKKGKRYKYKKSDSYINATKSEQKERRKEYIKNKVAFGKKTANRIEYAVDKYGFDRQSAKKTQAKQVVVKRIARQTAPHFVKKAAIVATGAAVAIKFNNYVVDKYAKGAGLNTIKGKPTLGLKQIKRGKQVIQRLNVLQQVGTIRKGIA